MLRRGRQRRRRPHRRSGSGLPQRWQRGEPELLRAVGQRRVRRDRHRFRDGNGNNNNNNGDGGGGGGDKAQCADNRDNDGDGVIDEDDPGCHEGNNINNPYNPDDDSEGSDNGGGGNAGSGDLGGDELPFTGTDVIGIALAGLLVLAGGLLLRRREEDVNTVR